MPSVYILGTRIRTESAELKHNFQAHRSRAYPAAAAALSLLAPFRSSISNGAYEAQLLTCQRA